jgi:hypothetical protein
MSPFHIRRSASVETAANPAVLDQAMLDKT